MLGKGECRDSLVSRPVTCFWDVHPRCDRCKDAHSAEQPSDFTLEIRFVGIDHIRVAERFVSLASFHS